ncbi:hypothetical protein RFI_36564 [Reticulomyxa filosa]|uniref:Reverse transcriptase domain-containing protein n=1 Tax=Reticulomyxa filosa TaxID=46433 RepID=X6LHR9_RETFI|nr:hypothetical protein RFI_36564 [Reticulomyxa filosa]|eukprot:ETO00876.1 hypothetical protein RFI_36564 [Reticulomyxa filosa]
MCRLDLHSTKKIFGTDKDKFQKLCYELCWIEISIPCERKSIMFCKVKEARKITEFIVIGGDWNAYHSAWLDKDIDDLVNLFHLITFMKQIDLSHQSTLHFVLNQLQDGAVDSDELDVHSYNLPITFDIKTHWSSPEIKKQKIETCNLRIDKWNLYRQILGMKLGIGKTKYWNKYYLEREQALEKEVYRLKRKFRKNIAEINYKKYKRASMQLKRKLKHKYLIKSIESLKGENTKQLFSQFKSMNSNKISVIPTLIEPTSGTIAKIDKEKAEMLVLYYSEETKGRYQLVEDKITAVIDTIIDEEMNCYPLWDEYHQMDITEDEVIEALRYISSHKAQGPDNIHNQMIKNSGQALIDSLIVLFNWSLTQCQVGFQSWHNTSEFFLKNRIGQVVLNGVSSSERKFEVGVPQGSSLYPLLFLLYINNITKFVKDPIQCGMFAYDVALWTSIYTSDENEMKSVDKISKDELKLNGNNIEEENHVKYLGLIVDQQIIFKQHSNYIYGKAPKKLGYLTFLCSYKGIRLSLSVYNLLYTTIIRLSLEYVCAFWNGAAESYKKNLKESKELQCIAKLPHPIKSPFDKWIEPTQEEILNTLDERTTAIFVDGSCKPDPGLGGVELVVQDTSSSKWI